MTPIPLLIKQALKTLKQTAQCQGQKPQRDKNHWNWVFSGIETDQKIWWHNLLQAN
jgi:hypothetical protein